VKEALSPALNLQFGNKLTDLDKARKRERERERERERAKRGSMRTWSATTE